MAVGYKNRTTPGVYITELDAFPPSIVGVPTAVPAFIGYTETAQLNGKPAYLQAVKVGSMADFETYFGGRFKAIYDIVQQSNPDPTLNNYDFSVQYEVSSPPSPLSPLPSPISPPSPSQSGTYYFYLKQTGDSEFNLYDSMRLFYANGGGNCFVVSVGPYSTFSSSNMENDLLAGLAVIREQVGPTMLVIPDAVLLPDDSGTGNSLAQNEEPIKPPYYQPFKKSSAFQNVVRAMLQQSIDLQDRVAILDVYSTLSVIDQTSMDRVVNEFHVNVGNDPKTLSYGMAYFPFVHSSVVQVSDFDYMNINEGKSRDYLEEILGWQAEQLYYDSSPGKYDQVFATIETMYDQTAPTAITSTNQNLSIALPLMAQILQVMVERNSVLPPSGAMAGIYNYIDGTRGVWNAPANVALNAVDRTTYKMNDKQQGDLNMPIDGKAIDALREFVGQGTLVWGARTLDGNSNDWRYVQVRRTIIYIEQSIKNALMPFVFAANDANTWVTVTAMVSNFLTNLWAQGGLMGAKASDAFTVQCGLGSTMTGMDILNGYMIVQVTLQMIHPAEFIELTFKQQMQGVG